MIRGGGDVDSDMQSIGPVIGKGMVADVHTYGPYALKLYHAGRPKADAFLEASILSMLEAHGLPAPRVHEVGRYEGRWGLVMDRADGQTLGAQLLAGTRDVGEGIDEMVRLQVGLHAVTEARLRPLKSRLADRIGRVSQIDAIIQNRVLARLAALPDGSRLCHGDFHPFNLIVAPQGTIIIDWLDATAGVPAADACRSYLLMTAGAPAIADQYLKCYADLSGIATADILAWLPCLAAARLAEGIESEEARLIDLARQA